MAALLRNSVKGLTTLALMMPVCNCSASNNNISQPARSHLYLKVLGETFQHFSQNQSIVTIEFRLEITSVPSYKVEI